MTKIFRTVPLLGLALAINLAGCAYTNKSVVRYKRPSTTMAESVGSGVAIGGLLASFAETSLPVGLVAGAAVGGTFGYIANSRPGIIYRIVNAGIPVIEYGENTIVVLPSDRIFDTDSSHMFPESTYIMNFITTLVHAHPDSAVTIAAYTDDVGSYAHNLHLSQNQADRVLSYFWAHGVDFHRLRATGYGPTPDVASNYTSLGSQFNRRVEIRIHPETA